MTPFFQERMPSADNRNNPSKFPELTSSAGFPSTQGYSPEAGSSEVPAETTSRNRSFSMNPCLSLCLGHQTRFSLFKVVSEILLPCVSLGLCWHHFIVLIRQFALVSYCGLEFWSSHLTSFKIPSRID